MFNLTARTWVMMIRGASEYHHTIPRTPHAFTHTHTRARARARVTPLVEQHHTVVSLPQHHLLRWWSSSDHGGSVLWLVVKVVDELVDV